jgi:hypothetical protein
LWQSEQGLVDFEVLEGQSGAARSNAATTTIAKLYLARMKPSPYFLRM